MKRINNEEHTPSKKVPKVYTKQSRNKIPKKPRSSRRKKNFTKPPIKKTITETNRIIISDKFPRKSKHSSHKKSKQFESNSKGATEKPTSKNNHSVINTSTKTKKTDDKIKRYAKKKNVSESKDQVKLIELATEEKPKAVKATADNSKPYHSVNVNADGEKVETYRFGFKLPQAVESKKIEVSESSNRKLGDEEVMEDEKSDTDDSHQESNIRKISKKENEPAVKLEVKESQEKTISTSKVEEAPNSTLNIDKPLTSTSTDEETPTSTSTNEETSTSTSTDEETPTSTFTDEETLTSTSKDEETSTSTSTDEETPTSTSTDEETPISTSKTESNEKKNPSSTLKTQDTFESHKILHSSVGKHEEESKPDEKTQSDAEEKQSKQEDQNFGYEHKNSKDSEIASKSKRIKKPTTKIENKTKRKEISVTYDHRKQIPNPNHKNYQSDTSYRYRHKNERNTDAEYETHEPRKRKNNSGRMYRDEIQEENKKDSVVLDLLPSHFENLEPETIDFDSFGEFSVKSNNE